MTSRLFCYFENSIGKNLKESAVQTGVVIRFLIAGDDVRVVAHQSGSHVHFPTDHRVLAPSEMSNNATIGQTSCHLT